METYVKTLPHQKLYSGTHHTKNINIVYHISNQYILNVILRFFNFVIWLAGNNHVLIHMKGSLKSSLKSEGVTFSRYLQ